jgi:CspA family cold shock protein
MRAPQSNPSIASTPNGTPRGASSEGSLEKSGFERLTGVVRRYDDMQGFGFITPDDGGPDVFAHVSEIATGGGEQSLVKGQRVTYDVITGPEGMQARSVMPLT